MQPTSQPSNQPSFQPTSQPSCQPSIQPTGQPSTQPSMQPSGQPSTQPSLQPTSQPSSRPSSQPTDQPTSQPSLQPSSQPSGVPSTQPSIQPSGQPSTQPSLQPTGQPSSRPSSQPTGRPTSQPSLQPSSQPSGVPSAQPSSQPSLQPSSQPSTQPSCQPSSQPSLQPTAQPSSQPSSQPTRDPSGQPSSQPTSDPSGQPSSQPSSRPSIMPSCQPSSQPSRQPSSQPSSQPSDTPTIQPTSRPSCQPTGKPSSQPTRQPSSIPSRQPTSRPSNRPSSQPTTQPSGQPSCQPSMKPTRQPSSQPSSTPTCQPTSQPTSPTGQPSRQPTQQPTGQPSTQPSSYPTLTHAPSSQPTTSYSYFDDKGILSSYKYSFSDALRFDVGISKISSFSASSNAWGIFKLKSLQSTFNWQRYYLSVWQTSVGFGSPRHLISSAKCTDIELSNKIIQNIVAEINFNISCDGNSWSYQDDTLCVNCPAGITSLCPVPTGTAMVIPPPLKCQNPNTFSKVAAVLLVRQRLVPPPTLPTISNLTYIAGKSNIKVSMIIDYKSPGYTVTCAAFGRKYPYVANILQSTASIIFAKNKVAITASVSNKGSKTLLLQIESLLSSITYDVYCYGQDAFGGGTDIERVKDTLMVVKTLCCRSISYTNFPTYVIQNPAVYLPTEKSKFLFSYALSSIPENSLIVTPSLVKVGVDYNSTVSVKPYAFVFGINSSDPSSLVGSFILSTEDSGLFKVSLTLTGKDKDIYENSPKLLQILDVNAPPLPPVLATVKFLDSGGGLLATFDSNTDSGKTVLTSSSWACSAIFIFPDDASSSCSWISDTTVKVLFSQGAVTKVGDTITWKPNKIKARCSKTFCNEYGYSNNNIILTISSPDNPMSPVVNLKVPNIVSACEDVIVDASSSYGNGGRVWKSITFTLSATLNFARIDNGNITEINDMLKTIKSIVKPFVIPSANLDSTWDFMLSFKLENFLGAVTEVSKSFKKSNIGDIPRVSFSGPSDLATTTSSTLELLAIGTPSTCTSSKKLIYSWAIFKEFFPVLSLSSASLDPRKMKIIPNSLEPGKNYHFLVVATTLSGNSANATASVYVKPGSVVAKIRQGTSRQIPTDQSFILTSDSYDEDATFYKNLFPLSYNWICTYFSVAKYGQSCDADIFYTYEVSGELSQVSTNQKMLNVPAYVLNTNETYEISVTVSSVDGRSNSASIIIYPTEPGAPSVYITSNLAVGGKVNPLSQFTANGQVQSPAYSSCAWTILDPSINIADIAKASTTTILPSSPKLQSFPLTIDTSSLTTGQSYSFELKCTNVKKSSLFSNGLINIVINVPPTSGSFTISPSTGYSMTTDFEFSVADWLDDVADLPLLYKFSYTLMNTGTAYNSLCGFREITSAKTTLPSGKAAYDNKIFGLAQISDSMGAISTTTQEVTVTIDTSVDMSAVIGAQLDTGLSSALESGDPDAANAMIGVLTTLMNAISCDLAPNTFCASLNRNRCSIISNMCDSCLDGYLGADGPGTSKCVKNPFGNLPAGYSVKSDFSIYNLKPYSEVSVGCIDDDQCPFGFCTAGVCKPLMKACPSAIKSEICSGKGSCVYVDGSGNSLAECQLMDSTCSAMCVCNDAYAGFDCSSTSTAVKTMEDSRSKMCSALGHIAEVSDPSSDTLASLSSSLSSTFNPYQFQSDGAILNCLGAYESIFSLSGQGFLSSVSGTTDIVKILSSFLENKKLLKSQKVERANQQELRNRTASRYLLDNNKFQSSFKPLPGKKKWGKWFPPFKSVDVDKHISAGLEMIIQGIMNSMIPGEAPRFIITDNLRIGVYYESIDSFKGKVFEIPKTLYEVLFNVDVPKIYMPMSGLSSCSLVDGLTHIQASFSTWGFNHYPQSDNMVTPLIRFSTKLPTLSYSASSIITSPSTEETFQVSLPFLRKFEFNGGFNSTFPSCAQRGDDSYSHCRSSNVSYTSSNVIFTLSDSSTICPVLGGYNRRRLYSSSAIGASLLASADPTTGVLELGSLVQRTKEDIIYLVEYYPIESIIACVAVFCISCIFGIGIFRRWDIYDQKLILYYLDGITSYVGTQMKNMNAKTNASTALGPLRSLHQNASSRNVSSDLVDMNSINTILSPSQKLKQSLGKSKDKQPLSQLSHMVSQKRFQLSVTESTDNAEEVSFTDIYSQNEGDFIDESKKVDNNTQTLDTSNEYIHSILPYNAMTEKESIWARAVRGLVENHDYFKMFSPHKLFTESRTVDFIALCSRLLTALFITTIFFQIMYPANYSCETRIFDIPVNVTQKEACLADTTIIQPTVPECVWHRDNRTCTRRSPPDSVVFYLLVALFVELVNVFPMLLMRRLADICSRKPYFLQPSTKRNLTEMDLARALPLRKQKISPLGQLLVDKKLVREEHGVQFASEKIRNFSLHADPNLMYEIKNDSFATILAKHTYYDLASSEEELSMLFKNIKLFL